MNILRLYQLGTICREKGSDKFSGGRCRDPAASFIHYSPKVFAHTMVSL